MSAESTQLLLFLAIVGLTVVSAIDLEEGELTATFDLSEMTDIGKVLIGRGWAEFEGETLPGERALARAGLEAIALGPKEALGLIQDRMAELRAKKSELDGTLEAVNAEYARSQQEGDALHCISLRSATSPSGVNALSVASMKGSGPSPSGNTKPGVS